LFEGGRPTGTDPGAVEKIDLAHVLVDHGTSLLERADELAKRETTYGYEHLRRGHELLTEEKTTFPPADTYGDTAIQDRLQETYEIRHADLPDRLHSLMDEIQESFEETTDVAYEW